jgi:ligand-binding sensor domain-containing protein
MYLFLVCATVCLLLLSAASTARVLEPRTRMTQYAHKAWRIGDAGLLGTPQSITQTRDGYVWVSTNNGLFRLTLRRSRKKFDSGS